MQHSEVLSARHGSLARLTLNRPAALNALGIGMVEAIDHALSEWEADPLVSCVLLDGAGTKGLCAGGDVRAMRQNVLNGTPERADTYLATEYGMNARIAAFPKPFVAFMDGIVMGGGVGVSAHGSHRIVTERTRLAMPEVAIGFLPDVGGTWLLARAPGEFGIHAGLTGASLSAFDALECGLADVHVASERLPELADALGRCVDAEAVTRAVRAVASPPARTGFTVDGGWIDRCYRGNDPAAILAALRAAPEAGAQAAADAIAAACPMSVAVTLRALRLAPVRGGLVACLEMERLVGIGLLRRPDFAEGVRAVLVDKDRAPRWSPESLDAVDPAELDALFAPLSAPAGGA